MTIDQLIASLEGPERVGDKSMRRGFTLGEFHTVDHVQGFILCDEWSDLPYRAVWTSLEYSSILTYCEGDITLEEYDSHSDYLQGVEVCDRFYAPQHYPVLKVSGVGEGLSGYDK